MAEATKPVKAPYEMTQDDIAAVNDSKELTTLGIICELPLVQIVTGGNVRTDKCLKLHKMIASLRTHGYKRNHPLVVSLKGVAVGSNPVEAIAAGADALLLCGNRRYLSIAAIREQQPALYTSLFPTGSIPALVYVGLSEKEEALIRLDHSEDEDREPLDEFSEFLSVKQLVRAGYGTEAGIAAKLGKVKLLKDGTTEPNRSWAQPRVALAGLPRFVQDAFRQLCEDKRSTNLRIAHIMKLAKAINDDVRFASKEKVNPVNDAGTHFADGGGPAFTALWGKIVAGELNTAKPEKPESGEADEQSKMMSSGDLQKRVGALESRIVKNACRAVLDVHASPSLSDVDDAGSRAEVAEALLSDIANCLGEKDFSKLQVRVSKWKAAEAAKVPADADAELVNS